MSNKDYGFWSDVTNNVNGVKDDEKHLNSLRHLQKNYLNVKSPVGFSGITNIYHYYDKKLSYKQIKDFLKTVDSYTLHKKSRVLQHNPSFSRYYKHQLQLDLVDVQKLSKFNDGVRFILSGINPFTRFGYCEPLKDKKGSTVLDGFKSI